MRPEQKMWPCDPKDSHGYLSVPNIRKHDNVLIALRWSSSWHIQEMELGVTQIYVVGDGQMSVAPESSYAFCSAGLVRCHSWVFLLRRTRAILFDRIVKCTKYR